MRGDGFWGGRAIDRSGLGADGQEWLLSKLFHVEQWGLRQRRRAAPKAATVHFPGVLISSAVGRGRSRAALPQANRPLFHVEQ
jgi:hypothetical protein